MPMPHYVPFRQKIKPASLREVTGGMSPGEVLFEIERGARFVVFEYTISVVYVSYRRRSEVHFLRPGQSAVVKGLPYALLSLIFGWWGYPHGVIETPGAIYRTLRGGKDITQSVLDKVQGYMGRESAAAASGVGSSPVLSKAEEASDG